MSSWPSTLLPITVAASVSPMLFSEQLLLLAGPNGRRYGAAFAGGAATILGILVVLILRFGGSVRLPHMPHLSASLDLLIGLILMGSAYYVWQRGSRAVDTVDRQKSPAGVVASYGFGLFSMATNFTTLPLIAAGAKDISASGMSDLWMLFAVCVLVCGGCLPVLTPLALERLPHGPRVLGYVSSLLRRYGKGVMVVLLAASGALFAVEAVWAFAVSRALF